ncbi:MAG TPA: prephenate dehydrogenase, partial [Synergistales bacterium]|nr:prephenate dehydrogenase [Synergistales bacterium]
LVAGWDHFWPRELEERKKLDLPPWKYLVEITNLAGNKERIKTALLKKGYEALDPGGPEGMVWLKCDELDELRGTLAPFFQISGSPRGFPRISLRSE